jgi:hypothetical protein
MKPIQLRVEELLATKILDAVKARPYTGSMSIAEDVDPESHWDPEVRERIFDRMEKMRHEGVLAINCEHLGPRDWAYYATGKTYAAFHSPGYLYSPLRFGCWSDANRAAEYMSLVSETRHHYRAHAVDPCGKCHDGQCECAAKKAAAEAPKTVNRMGRDRRRGRRLEDNECIDAQQVGV